VYPSSLFFSSFLVHEIIIFLVANSIIFEKIEKKNRNFANIYIKKGCVLLPKQSFFSVKFDTIANKIKLCHKTQ
jgi:hypothetical protein